MLEKYPFTYRITALPASPYLKLCSRLVLVEAWTELSPASLHTGSISDTIIETRVFLAEELGAPAEVLENNLDPFSPLAGKLRAAFQCQVLRDTWGKPPEGIPQPVGLGRAYLVAADERLADVYVETGPRWQGKGLATNLNVLMLRRLKAMGCAGLSVRSSAWLTVAYERTSDRLRLCRGSWFRLAVMADAIDVQRVWVNRHRRFEIIWDTDIIARYEPVYAASPDWFEFWPSSAGRSSSFRDK